jgi:glycosyltransferase involved in cell wall biosynthesis
VRVLHVISEMGSGGAETLVAGMVTAGSHYGWESAVASGGGHRADALRAAGVSMFHVPVARRSAVGMARAIAATALAVRNFRPDVLLAHNVSASLAAHVAAPLGWRPVVTVFHGVADADYPSTARILRRTSRSVVTVAEPAAERLRAAGLRSPEPVVIPNAVFPRPARHGRAAVRAALRIPPQVPVALCVARLEPQKRHDVLLAAWSLVDCDAVLLLAGDGSLRADLTRQVADRGLTGRVRFLGNRDDVPDLLVAADATVLTSDWEGMPIAVLESLAAGRPVVASDVDGVRAAVGDGGIVVRRRDPVATASALRTLLFDPDFHAAASASGLAAIRRDHDPHRLMKSYDEVLRVVRKEKRR